MSSISADVTRLLSEAIAGRTDAWNRLTPLVYHELYDLAAAAMQRERGAHTLQPTALVNEAFIRLIDQSRAEFNSRTHFYGAAANVMRRVLVDYARARLADKRGGGRAAQPLDEALVAFEQRSTDLLALDAALTKLAALDPEQARIVELRFFGGLTVDETAALVGVSTSSIERAWRMARAWLLREVTGPDTPGHSHG